jgi:hypothetical protein
MPARLRSAVGGASITNVTGTLFSVKDAPGQDLGEMVARDGIEHTAQATAGESQF